jgi:excisionase family DNA binding protein
MVFANVNSSRCKSGTMMTTPKISDVVCPVDVYFGWPEAEAYTKLSRVFFQRKIRAGELQALRVGGRTLLRRRDLDEFLERHRTTGPVNRGRGRKKK